MKWISVEDRLPETDIENGFDSSEDVLIYGKSAFFGEYMVTVGWINDKKEWQFIYPENDMQNITHWQPLPEPPKE